MPGGRPKRAHPTYQQLQEQGLLQGLNLRQRKQAFGRVAKGQPAFPPRPPHRRYYLLGTIPAKKNDPRENSSSAGDAARCEGATAANAVEKVVAVLGYREKIFGREILQLVRADLSVGEDGVAVGEFEEGEVISGWPAGVEWLGGLKAARGKRPALQKLVAKELEEDEEAFVVLR